MMSAIALSGGGAKGDFQVGALRYLHDQGVRPDILAAPRSVPSMPSSSPRARTG